MKFPPLRRPSARQAAHTGGVQPGGSLAPGAVAVMDAPPAAPAPAEGPDYPEARWVAAARGNYRPADRPAQFPIRYVVLRLIEGTYENEIRRYQDPALGSSAHYLVRFQDGEITQMVREKDIALCSGKPGWLEESIVIAHEGLAEAPEPISGDALRASAALARFVCRRYGIQADRQHILGYDEISGTRGPEVGSGWDWVRYLALAGAEPGVVVDNGSPQRFWCSGQWSASNWNALRYGPDYRLALPVRRRDAAWYRVPFSRAGRYAVYAWFPSAGSYNASTPVVLFTSEGSQVLHLDQRTGGGRWVPLGIFPFQQGDHWAVAVSRWTESPGYVIADAFRFVPTDE